MNQITNPDSKVGGFLTRSRWNPYFVGIGIGLLSWAVFAIVNAPLGVTTSLSQWAGLAAEPVMGVEGVRANPYWAKDLPKWDYGTFFLIGTFFGALVGAWLSRDLKIEVVPTVWRERFGGSPAKRLAVAFVGGNPGHVWRSHGGWLHKRQRTERLDATGGQRLDILHHDVRDRTSDRLADVRRKMFVVPIEFQRITKGA